MTTAHTPAPVVFLFQSFFSGQPKKTTAKNSIAVFFGPFQAPAPPMPRGMERSHLREKTLVFPTKKSIDPPSWDGGVFCFNHFLKNFPNIPRKEHTPEDQQFMFGNSFNLGGWGGLGYAPFGVCCGSLRIIGGWTNWRGDWLWKHVP